jgi:four helix bundle protein
MQRAAVSIPSNIAEGHSRYHGKEYLHHLSVALGSLAELETQVEIARRLEYLTGEKSASMLASLESLGRQLHALRDALAKKVEQQ